MKLLDRRAKKICEELKMLSKKQSIEISKWKYKEGLFLTPDEAQKGEWLDFDGKNMHWYGKDRHYWFKTIFEVPETFDKKPLWLVIRTQIDEWDDARNPQFLLFVDKKPVQGIDMNHREVFIAEFAQAGRQYEIDLQAYSGINHSEFNLIVEAVEFDSKILDLYYDLKVPLEAFSRMDEDSKIRLDLQTVINNTVNLLDLRNEYSEEFYESVSKASSYIKKALYEDMAGFDEVTAACIGHTHIDVAWWWTVAQTREKVARSFSTVLKLMEEYPNYKFISSQPQLYVFLKERYPKLFDEIKKRVKEGRWEAEGGMWVEADCNLTSGESLVRQFMYGKRFFKEEFGVDSKILWLPDVFGYSGALPQIMKKCGIEYFMTTKLSWNQFNKVPYDTMMWRGIDGTEIFTHMITTLGVGQDVNNFFTTYNGMLHPDSIMGAWQRYQNKEINNDILISYGYGDGGGGPTREMLETSVRMEKGIKGIPKVRQEFAGEYFKKLEKRVKDNKRLPVWEGEFYFEYHRGTYTSMARNKRSNRKSELMLMDLELFSVLAQNKGISYPHSEIERIWKVVLLNQFHDILPGSSIKEVYDVTKKEYEEISKTGSSLISERVKALTQPGDAVTVYNTLGFERNDIVNLGEVKAAALADEMGKIYPVQQTETGAVAYLEKVPSKGGKTFSIIQKANAENPFKISGSRIETPFYVVDFDKLGMISSIYDKENEREVIKENQRGNLMRVYEDKPVDYDNWDIDIFYSEKFWDVEDLMRMEWTEKGPVRATLEIERKFSKSVIKQKIYFYANSRRIDFCTYVDWKEHQHLLKVHFPVDVHTDEATFDIQFGNLTRKTHTNTSWDMARFEVCGHKWADLSEGGYGFSLLNDCKYGYSVKDGNIALTLIKSGILPNPVADQEEHFFTYSIYPHKGGWRDGDVVREAAKINQPAYALKGTIEKPFSFVSTDKKNVMIETVKCAEDGSGVIIRMYECENAKTKMHVLFESNVNSVYECDLLENEIKEIKAEATSFEDIIKPYEIKTYKVTFAE